MELENSIIAKEAAAMARVRFQTLTERMFYVLKCSWPSS